MNCVWLQHSTSGRNDLEELLHNISILFITFSSSPSVLRSPCLQNCTEKNCMSLREISLIAVLWKEHLDNWKMTSLSSGASCNWARTKRGLKKWFECTHRGNHNFVHLVWCSDRINHSFLLAASWADTKSLQGQNRECSRDLTAHRIYVAADHHPIQKHLARVVCLASTSNFHQSEMSRDQKDLRAEGNLCWGLASSFTTCRKGSMRCTLKGRTNYTKLF